MHSSRRRDICHARAIVAPFLMRLSAVAAEVLVSALLVVAAVIALTGGGRIELAGAVVSARSWSRPLAAALLLFLAVHAAGVARGRVRIDEVARRFAMVVTASLCAVALAFSARYIIHACGGLDSHGYVAFSELISRGRLSRPLPDLPWLMVDRPAEVIAPLGFVPSADGQRLVPEFPPGLPLLLAVARIAAGPGAVFWVSWLCEIALVFVVFATARERYGTLTGGLAAVLIAAHPVVAAYSMQAMSDVPATLATALAVYALLARSQPMPVLAGLAASLAILIRPPLAIPVMVLGFFSWRRTPRVAWTMAAWTVPGLLGLMVLQFVMFRNPLVSGHGSAGHLFTTATLTHNLAAHAKWFVIVHTPLTLLALWLGWRTDRYLATVLFAIALAEALPYFFYGVPFDDWEMLRFLLPGIALLVPVAAEGVAGLLRRLPGSALPQVGVVVVAIAALTASKQWLDAHGYLTMSITEMKYPRTGEWFTTRTSPETVVFASLHSGSVNYYSGRLTVRWDAIPADRLAPTLDALAARGTPAYVVLDGDDEQAQFQRRFGTVLGTRVRVEPVDRIFTTLIATIESR
jgi:hypothetical protein